MMREKKDFIKQETLISQANSYLQSDTLSDFYKNSYLLNLIEALGGAITVGNLKNVKAISGIFSQVIKQDPVNFTLQLSKEMDTGPFKGQTFVFTLADQLYSAVLMRDSVSSLHMTSILSELLREGGDDFVMALTHQVQWGTNKGMTPLTPLIEALLFSTKTPSNLDQTKLILDFLVKTIHYSPKIMRPELIVPLQYKIYSGQMLITYLIKCLDLFSQKNPGLVKIVTDELSSTVLELTKEQVQVAFSALVKEGPDGGTSAIDLLLNALRTASFATHNDESIKNILSVIELLYSNHPDFRTAMIRDIVVGDKKNKNGATMLVEAIIKTSSNNLNIIPLCIFLEKMIKDLGAQVITNALQRTIKYRDISYIDSLKNYVTSHPELDLNPMKRILSHVSKPPGLPTSQGFFVEAPKATLDDGSLDAKQEQKL